MASRLKRSQTPSERLRELQAELERLALLRATNDDERAVVRRELERMPRRLQDAHERQIRGEEGESPADVEQAQGALRARAIEAGVRADALHNVVRAAEEAVSAHYDRHLEHFAAVADEATVRAEEARDALLAAAREAEATWQEAMQAWSPVVAAFARTRTDVSLNHPPPAPFDQVFALVELWQSMSPRPSQVAPGGGLPTAAHPWPAAHPARRAA